MSAVDAATAGENDRKRKLLVLSDLDSRVKWGASLASFFQDSCEITIMFEEIPASIRDRYILPNYLVEQYRDLSVVLSSPSLFSYDYIILALGGAENVRALNAISERQSEFPVRPIVIAGFNGLVEPGDSHGFLCRQGADIICVNSKRDLAFFQMLSQEFQLDEAALILAGYLRKNDKLVVPLQSLPPQNILFVEQVGRPPHLRQKIHLVQQLVSYAQAHPDRRIVIKLRDAGWVRHANSSKEKYSFRTLWKTMALSRPSNVVFSSESIEALLPKTDLCISIASTVLFEALSLGKKVAVLKDFGIGTHMGNTAFIGSGLFASMRDLKQDKLPEVSASWLRDNGSFSESFLSDITTRLRSLDEQRAQGMLKPIEVFYDRTNFPYFQSRKNPFRKFRKWMFCLRRISFHLRRAPSKVEP